VAAAWNFRELRYGDVQLLRIYLLHTRVKKGMRKSYGSSVESE